MIEEFTYDQYPSDRDYGPTVLIVDDEKSQRERMIEICSATHDAKHLRVLSCETVPEALEIISTGTVDVVLLDKNLGCEEGDPDKDKNGIEAIPKFLKVDKHLQILVVTASRKIPDAVNAIRYGALNYVTKESPDELILAQVNKAIDVAKIAKENTLLTRGGKKIGKTDLAGSSKIIKGLKIQLRAVSESNRPVLLLGENGTGKTTAAMMIHEMRAQFLKQNGRPFFEINCGALAPTLIERELFGNEANAYTGGKEPKAGYFELANNGTLFLDEIAELTKDLQVKLLKVLQNGKFNRLGIGKERHSNFRLICATNRDIEQMVADGSFREDLYMRIAVLIVRVPTLRQRKDDIPEIIKSLLPQACTENHVQVDFKEFPKDLIDHLKEIEIKGNIRGIEHVLTRLLIHAPRDKDGHPLLDQWRSVKELDLGPVQNTENRVVTLEDILRSPLDIVKPGFPGFKEIVEIFKDRLIADAKKKYNSDVDVARALKISPAAVNIRRKKLKLISTSKFLSPSENSLKLKKEVVQ